MTEPPSRLIDATHGEKRKRLLDLLRRATANGTHKEVADAIAHDWFPLCRIDAKGKIEFMIGEITTGGKE